MEEKKNNKNLILIIIALVLVAGICLFVGISIGSSNKGSENIENKEVVELDEVTALTLVQYLYDDAMEIYTFEALDNCTWKIDNDNCVNLSEFWDKNPNGGYIKITNYDEVMNDVFTKTGLEQFEKFMKEELSSGNKFIKRENQDTYALAPTSGFYTGYVNRNLKINNITENEIQATIDIVASALFFGEEEDVTETKNIVIKKENNKWLIEEFAIPMH